MLIVYLGTIFRKKKREKKSFFRPFTFDSFIQLWWRLCCRLHAPHAQHSVSCGIFALNDDFWATGIMHLCCVSAFFAFLYSEESPFFEIVLSVNFIPFFSSSLEHSYNGWNDSKTLSFKDHNSRVNIQGFSGKQRNESDNENDGKTEWMNAIHHISKILYEKSIHKWIGKIK